MLTGQDTTMALAAVLTAVLGVVALYLSWRKQMQAKRLMLAAGWALIALSFFFWIRSAGAEFGPVIAAMQLSIVAWMVVLANRHVRSGNGRSQVPGKPDPPRFGAIARHAGTFLVAVPLAACCSSLLILAAATVLPTSDANRLAFTVLTVPVAWGVFAYWTCAETGLLRPALGLIAGITVGATILYI